MSEKIKNPAPIAEKQERFLTNDIDGCHTKRKEENKKYINNFHKNQLTGMIAKFGISIFSNAFNAEISESERESYYEVVELIKNIIVKINEKDIPLMYYNIIDNMINEFRKNNDKTDNFDIPIAIWTVVYDILDISQIDAKDCENKNTSISEQDLEKIFETLNEETTVTHYEPFASSKLIVKPEENTDSISEERFAKIVDRLYEMVHNPPVRNAKARLFPDMKISEYAALFGL